MQYNCKWDNQRSIHQIQKFIDKIAYKSIFGLTRILNVNTLFNVILIPELSIMICQNRTHRNNSKYSTKLKSHETGYKSATFIQVGLQLGKTSSQKIQFSKRECELFKYDRWNWRMITKHDRNSHKTSVDTKRTKKHK